MLSERGILGGFAFVESSLPNSTQFRNYLFIHSVLSPGLPTRVAYRGRITTGQCKPRAPQATVRPGSPSK
jgi:hypothetical protein